MGQHTRQSVWPALGKRLNGAFEIKSMREFNRNAAIPVKKGKRSDLTGLLPGVGVAI
jgi:hypothetical protein